MQNWEGHAPVTEDTRHVLCVAGKVGSGRGGVGGDRGAGGTEIQQEPRERRGKVWKQQKWTEQRRVRSSPRTAGVVRTGEGVHLGRAENSSA